MSYDDFGDFDSPDPIIRFNAHAAAKGHRKLPDPDRVRKQQKEHQEEPGCTCGRRGICTFCQLRSFEEQL